MIFLDQTFFNFKMKFFHYLNEIFFIFEVCIFSLLEWNIFHISNVHFFVTWRKYFSYFKCTIFHYLNEKFFTFQMHHFSFLEWNIFHISNAPFFITWFNFFYFLSALFFNVYDDLNLKFETNCCKRMKKCACMRAHVCIKTCLNDF